MNILETLIKLRDDLKTWVTNNLVALDAKIESKTIPIDSKLSTDSTNPVQNKVIAGEITNLNNLVGDTPVSEQIEAAIANQPDVDLPNITDDESGEFNIADPNGNVIFKADKDGIHTTNINTTGEDFNIADSDGNLIFKVDAEGAHTTDITIDGISIKDKMAEWDNGSGGSSFSGDYNDLTNKPELAEVATSGDYNDLSNKPNITDDGSDKYVIADDDGNIILEVDSEGAHTTDIEVAGTSIADKISEWDAKSDFSGNYNDLSNKPSSLKNPAALTFGSKRYDGSSAQTILATDLGLSPIAASDLTYIGYVTFGGGSDEDVTSQITFKPGLEEACPSVNTFRPMAVGAEGLGSGVGEGMMYYFSGVDWDYFSLSFDLYFYAFEVDGTMKRLRLHYQYAESDASTPQSITAVYL